jgi:hypothetical protein
LEKCKQALATKYNEKAIANTSAAIKAYSFTACELGILGLKEVAFGRTAAGRIRTTDGAVKIIGRGLFYQACVEGDIERAEWICRMFPNLNIGAEVRAATIFMTTLFSDVCGAGHIRIATWLANKAGLTADDIRAQHVVALVAACAQGQISIAVWLVIAFKLTIEDICTYGKNALRAACVSSHIALVTWLLEYFAIRTAHIPDRMALLRDACEGGTEILKLITKTVTFTMADLVSAGGLVSENILCYKSVLSWVCIKGKLDAAKFLAAYFTLTAEVVRDYDYQILKSAFASESPTMVAWVMQTFEITNAELAKVDTHRGLSSLCPNSNELVNLLMSVRGEALVAQLDDALASRVVRRRRLAFVKRRSPCGSSAGSPL